MRPVRTDAGAAHRAPITANHFSPDGCLLATASLDGTAKLWDPDLDLLRTLAHDRLVNGVRFDHSGTRLATASADGTARVWSVPDGECLAVLARHRDDVNDVAFGPDDSMMVTVSEDGTGRLWELRTSGLVDDVVLSHADHCMAVDWSTAGLIATCGDDAKVGIWGPDGRQLASVALPTDAQSCRWSPAGDRLAVTGDDGWLRLFDVAGRPIGLLGRHPAPVKSVAWSPQGGHVAVGLYNSSVVVWALDMPGAPAARFCHPRLWPRSLTWSSAETLAVGTFDGTPFVLHCEEER